MSGDDMVDDGHVAAVRSFNRFWTAQIGVLDAGLVETPYSLTEARVLYELAQADETDLLALRRRLALDSGYLSRIMSRFKADGLVETEASRADGRRQVIRLTPAGQAAFAVLDARSADVVRAQLEGLGTEGRRRLVAAMAAIEDVFSSVEAPQPYVIRSLRAGDLGWVVHRHGVLYAQEYGWDATFEALVARVVADYVDHHNPRREDAWIAEVDGEPVGCVFCIRRDDRTAQLRILLVEPKARGLGIGARLVEECIRFARRAGYDEMVLWTNDVLVSARRIYEAAGFTLVEEEAHHSFGHDLMGQTWRLDLRSGRGGDVQQGLGVGRRLLV
jgi:DNA-binding MarR family transcriptional regulator/GNAT superfamily N-acetyltransferase